MAHFIISIQKDSYVLVEADSIEAALSNAKVAAETAKSSDSLADPRRCEWIRVEARQGIARMLFGEHRIVDDTARWAARHRTQSQMPPQEHAIGVSLPDTPAQVVKLTT
jgi:hypothetical protein